MAFDIAELSGAYAPTCVVDDTNPNVPVWNLEEEAGEMLARLAAWATKSGIWFFDANLSDDPQADFRTMLALAAGRTIYWRGTLPITTSALTFPTRVRFFGMDDTAILSPSGGGYIQTSSSYSGGWVHNSRGTALPQTMDPHQPWFVCPNLAGASSGLAIGDLVTLSSLDEIANSSAQVTVMHPMLAAVRVIAVEANAVNIAGTDYDLIRIERSCPDAMSTDGSAAVIKHSNVTDRIHLANFRVENSGTIVTGDRWLSIVNTRGCVVENVMHTNPAPGSIHFGHANAGHLKHCHWDQGVMDALSIKYAITFGDSTNCQVTECEGIGVVNHWVTTGGSLNTGGTGRFASVHGGAANRNRFSMMSATAGSAALDTHSESYRFEFCENTIFYQELRDGYGNFGIGDRGRGTIIRNNVIIGSHLQTPSSSNFHIGICLRGANPICKNNVVSGFDTGIALWPLESVTNVDGSPTWDGLWAIVKDNYLEDNIHSGIGLYESRDDSGGPSGLFYRPDNCDIVGNVIYGGMSAANLTYSNNVFRPAGIVINDTQSGRDPIGGTHIQGNTIRKPLSGADADACSIYLGEDIPAASGARDTLIRGNYFDGWADTSTGGLGDTGLGFGGVDQTAIDNWNDYYVAEYITGVGQQNWLDVTPS